MLRGRSAETSVVDELLDRARAGHSGFLVIRGDPGVGKTALLEYARQRAAGFRVASARGAEAEADLPFAGLQLLLRPALDHVSSLPDPQAAALRGAFGLARVSGEDRFLAGMAALSLLSELAGEDALLCLVDDAQWLDPASTDALAFVAHRLRAEGIAFIMATTEPVADERIRELHLRGLGKGAAAVLLKEHAPHLDTVAAARVLDVAKGNPLALLELPAALESVRPENEIALPERLLEAFTAQVRRLPPAAQMTLLVAALDGTGDLATLSRVLGEMGVPAEGLDAVQDAGLLDRNTLAFRHSLVRTAVIQAASLSQRSEIHRVLARVLGAADDADRRAWHRAASVSGRDDEIADDLERTARRARDRGGYAAHSAALRRAAELSTDPGTRAQRLIAAAESACEAGQLDRAGILARAAERASRESGPAVVEITARVSRIRANVEFEQGSPLTASRILVAGAERVAPAVAAAMLVEAVRNSYIGGDPGLAVRAAGKLAGLPVPRSPLLAGACALARMLDGDPESAVGPLRDLTAAAPALQVPGERLFAGAMAFMTGDDDVARELFTALTDDCSAAGALGWLPYALEHLAMAELFAGWYADALAHANEGLELAEATGYEQRAGQLRCVLTWLAAIRGDEERCREQAGLAVGAATARDVARSAGWGSLALSLLDLGLGRHLAVVERLEAAFRGPAARQLSATLAAPYQVEAAVRLGEARRAAEPLARFERWAAATGAPWAAAVTARLLALTGTGAVAEDHYLRALALHGSGGGRPFERARTELLYGTWLRRSRRAKEARVLLRGALDRFEHIGAVPWADSARAELRATGERITSSPASESVRGLTAQELQVVRLAAQGLSNRDIASQLFLSPRTVGYHLYKAYPKLGVATRTELRELDLSAAS